jgi:hypothetical protein
MDWSSVAPAYWSVAAPVWACPLAAVAPRLLALEGAVSVVPVAESEAKELVMVLDAVGFSGHIRFLDRSANHLVP